MANEPKKAEEQKPSVPCVIGGVIEEPKLSMPCVICGVFVELTEREEDGLLAGIRPVKVCRGCKDAVAFAKAAMKNRE
jgi:hypothetical protein